MRKPDVINIQHAHCGLEGPGSGATSSSERPLPAKDIPMCQAQGCIQASLTASAWRRRRAAPAYVQM